MLTAAVIGIFAATATNDQVVIPDDSPHQISPRPQLMSGVQMLSATIGAPQADAPAEYYNLQGIRVANPAHGIYIERRGSKATKVLIP